MKSVRNGTKLLLRSLMCLGLIFCMSFTSIAVLAAETQKTTSKEDAKTVKVVVATKDIAQGSKITKAQVALRTVPNVNIPSNAITEVSKVTGKYATADLCMGEYIQTSQVDGTKVAPLNNDLLIQAITPSDSNYVCVTDYFPANAGKDVGGLIQMLIDKNQGRTIYFPDGEYLISCPITTYSSGAKSTTIVLSEGAVLRADVQNWAADGDNDAIVCLGGKTFENDNRSNGSYFSIMGGTIDGMGKADCLDLSYGRESLVRNICLKNPKQYGLDIPHASNSLSSDMDVEDVIIIGEGRVGTAGMRLLGYDNTFTSVRIYNFDIGVRIDTSGGDTFRDCYIINPQKKTGTVGFQDNTGGNFYMNCYVQNFDTAYNLKGGSTKIDACRIVNCNKGVTSGSNINGVTR